LPKLSIRDRPLSENKVEETVEKCDRPENCENLVAPKVNPEINPLWEKAGPQIVRYSEYDSEGWSHYCTINSEAHEF